MQGPKWRSHALGAAIKVILPRAAAKGLAPWTPQRPRPIKNSLGNEFRHMTFVESELALLRDPRLAALATSPWPAWLWSADASRILWANAAGAALFGAADTQQCVQRRFDSGNNTTAAQIARLAATLPSARPPRLERLRGFGLGFGRALTCACSRVVVADGQAAVLVAAAEPAGPALSLAERVRRLFGNDEPLAVFAADGTLIHATSAARVQLGGANSLSALGIPESNLQGLGDGPTRVLVLSLPQPQAAHIEAADVKPSETVVPSAPPEASAAAPPAQPQP